MNAAGFYGWALAGAALPLLAALGFFDKLFMLGVLLGDLTALAHLFMLKRMAARAVSQGKRQPLLIFIAKFYLRFLLTAVILITIAYAGLLEPMGFLAGFSAVMLTMAGWGISCLRKKRHVVQ
jgi:hypothetical protein